VVASRLEAPGGVLLSNFERRVTPGPHVRPELIGAVPKYETSDYGFVGCTAAPAAACRAPDGGEAFRATARMRSGKLKGLTM